MNRISWTIGTCPGCGTEVATRWDRGYARILDQGGRMGKHECPTSGWARWQAESAAAWARWEAEHVKDGRTVPLVPKPAPAPKQEAPPAAARPVWERHR